MSFVTGTICLSCLAHHDLGSDHFTCPSCRGNLELVYDYPAAGEALRAGLAGSEECSILRYLPLLPISEARLYPPLLVGWSPLMGPERLRAHLGMPRLLLKDDSRNPSASFKDRASAVALAHAREQDARMICAASTGNAGSSMACLAASVGQPSVVFVPRGAPRAKVAQLLTFGARVFAVNGSYDDAFDLSLEASEAYGWYNRNTGTNPYTREGKKTCALEVCEQLGWEPPDRVLVPVGDGNIISGIWKGFRELMACGMIDRLPRVVAVQSTRSAAVARTVERLRGELPDPPGKMSIEPVQATTLADSISVDMPRDGVAAVRAVIESKGSAVTVSDEEILQAMGELARLSGVFAEPAGATAYAGLKAMLASGEMDQEERVVLLVTGNGLKDTTSALKAAGEPTVIEPSLKALEAVLGC